MEEIKIKLISLQDIVNAHALEIQSTIEIIEKVLIDFKKGNVLLPDKISQIFDENTQDRINCMPATLMKEKICGVKWVSVFPNNPIKFSTPNVSGIMILSELEKGYPYAVIEASLLTALRTACVGAVGAKYLARSDSKTYCSIGSGEQAKMHFMAIKYLFPNIKICKVASRSKQSEKKFVEELSKKYADVEFICCNSDYEQAALDADIIVTAVSCQKPLLKEKSIKQGAFYCHVGGWEDEYEVALKADKIVCDRWESVKHRSQTISRLYKAGKLKDEDIYSDICDIIDGTLPGRENNREFIYFNSVGLAFIDVAIAQNVYTKVCAAKGGIDWVMQNKDISEYLF